MGGNWGKCLVTQTAPEEAIFQGTRKAEEEQGAFTAGINLFLCRHANSVKKIFKLGVMKLVT